MSVPVIEARALGKIYRSGWGKKNVALRDLELEVQQGEVFGFIGPNGAGKSTTIRILMGLMKPSAGEARLLGKDVRDPEARIGVAYVPESPLLYDQLTPLELLTLHCKMQRVGFDNVRANALQWLERFDLAAVANKPIRGFSKGMTQRTALAHAMVIRPKLMILDEPLSGLDPIGRNLVVEVLNEYRAQGGSLFFSSHVLYDVERLADRYGFIQNGMLRTVQQPHEINQRDAKMIVASWGDSVVEGMQLQGNRHWRTEIVKHELWPLLQALQQAGHQITEVRAASNLEEVFLSWAQSEDDQ